MTLENPNIRFSVTFHFDATPAVRVIETISAASENHAKIALKNRYPNDDITILSITHAAKQ